MKIRSPYGLKRLFLKMHYHEQRIEVNQAAPYISYWNANSLYDPNSVFVGHQAWGWFQWTNHFKRYKVHACKIRGYFSNQATTPANGAWMGITFNKFGENTMTQWLDYVRVSAPTDMFLPITENPLIRFRHVTPYNIAKPARDYVTQVSYYRKTATVWGRSKLDDDNFEGVINSSNPANIWQFSLAVVPGDWNNSGGSTVVGTVRIKMTFWVELFQPQTNQNLGTGAAP